MKKGFTLAELLITLAVIGIVLAILIPLANNARPDSMKAKYLKTFDAIERVSGKLLNDTRLFPVVYSHDASHTFNVQKYPLVQNTNDTDFCRLFASYLKSKDNSVACGVGVPADNNAFDANTFTAQNGTLFALYRTHTLTTVANNLTGQAQVNIYFDLNPDNGTHTFYSATTPNPDSFRVVIDAQGRVYAADAMGAEYLRTRHFWVRENGNGNAGGLVEPVIPGLNITVPGGGGGGDDDDGDDDDGDDDTPDNPVKDSSDYTLYMYYYVPCSAQIGDTGKSISCISAQRDLIDDNRLLGYTFNASLRPDTTGVSNKYAKGSDPKQSIFVAVRDPGFDITLSNYIYADLTDKSNGASGNQNTSGNKNNTTKLQDVTVDRGVWPYCFFEKNVIQFEKKNGSSYKGPTGGDMKTSYISAYVGVPGTATFTRVNNFFEPNAIYGLTLRYANEIEKDDNFGFANMMEKFNTQYAKEYMNKSNIYPVTRYLPAAKITHDDIYIYPTGDKTRVYVPMNTTNGTAYVSYADLDDGDTAIIRQNYEYWLRNGETWKNKTGISAFDLNKTNWDYYQKFKNYVNVSEKTITPMGTRRLGNNFSNRDDCFVEYEKITKDPFNDGRLLHSITTYSCQDFEKLINAGNNSLANKKVQQVQ